MSRTEKIAHMMGKTTYKDFRQGFASGTFVGDSDADIKHALGIAQAQAGALAVQVLETRYASTLAHERAIRRAWEQHRKDGATATPVRRMAGCLAIRQLAGAPALSAREADEYAWMSGCASQTLEAEMQVCSDWLAGLCGDAKGVFLDALLEQRQEVT